MWMENGTVDKVSALQVWGSKSNLKYQCNELDMVTGTFNPSIGETKMLDPRETPVNSRNWVSDVQIPVQDPVSETWGCLQSSTTWGWLLHSTGSRCMCSWTHVPSYTRTCTHVHSHIYTENPHGTDKRAGQNFKVVKVENGESGSPTQADRKHLTLNSVTVLPLQQPNGLSGTTFSRPGHTWAPT